MKSIIALICLFALSAQLAFAQEDATWTDPTGRFSLKFDRWDAVPAEVAARGGYQLMISHSEATRDRPRVCALSVRPSPGETGRTQDQANGDISGWDNALLSQRLRAPVNDARHATVGGVVVLEYTVQMIGLQQHTRSFVLSDGATANLIDITCGARLPATDEEIASMAAVLETLSIEPRTSP